MSEILLTMNEDGIFVEYEEPFKTVAFETEEDFKHFENILEEYKKYKCLEAMGYKMVNADNIIEQLEALPNIANLIYRDDAIAIVKGDAK